jgi:hypothetical protein
MVVYAVPATVKLGIVMATELLSSKVADHKTVSVLSGVYVPAELTKVYRFTCAHELPAHSNIAINKVNSFLIDFKFVFG